MAPYPRTPHASCHVLPQCGNQIRRRRGVVSLGCRILTSSWDDTVEVWDAATGARLVTLSLPYVIADAAWSPSGEQIATGSSNPTVTVWDATTGDQLFNMGSHTESFQDVS